MKQNHKLVLIQVTEEDIKCGVVQDFTLCPVALAINRHTKFGAFVTEKYIGFLGKRPTFQTTKAMGNFVKAIDGCKPVKPTNFRIKLPTSVLKD